MNMQRVHHRRGARPFRRAAVGFLFAGLAGILGTGCPVCDLAATPLLGDWQVNYTLDGAEATEVWRFTGDGVFSWSNRALGESGVGSFQPTWRGARTQEQYVWFDELDVERVFTVGASVVLSRDRERICGAICSDLDGARQEKIRYEGRRLS